MGGCQTTTFGTSRRLPSLSGSSRNRAESGRSQIWMPLKGGVNLADPGHLFLPRSLERGSIIVDRMEPGSCTISAYLFDLAFGILTRLVYLPSDWGPDRRRSGPQPSDEAILPAPDAGPARLPGDG